jgi:hypothetical protein
LRCSKPDHRILLYFDSALIKQWIDPNGFAGEGTGMRFVQQGVSGSVKIGNLRVTKWNGVVENGAGTPDAEHDTLSLETGAKSVGEIESIANGQVFLRAATGETQIALAKITSIDFAHRAEASGKPFVNNVHATLTQGGSLTMKLLSWRPEAMEVESPDFGKASFDPAAFSRLKFFPPAEEPKS